MSSRCCPAPIHAAAAADLSTFYAATSRQYLWDRELADSGRVLVGGHCARPGCHSDLSIQVSVEQYEAFVAEVAA